MKKVKLFLLGQKGLAAMRACIQRDFIELIEIVVIGEDKNLKDDCSVDIRRLCKDAGVEYVMRRDYLNDEKGLQNNICYQESIGIASGWRWMIHEAFHPLIVIHDSLLPKYRGFNPLVSALLRRDEVIGATAILANNEFDKGNIIENDFFKVSYPITVYQAMLLMSEVIESITTKLLLRIKKSELLTGIMQDESLASYSVWRDQDDYLIEWSDSSQDILHFINCVSFPYAGASTFLDGEIVRILSATVLSDVEIVNRNPGKVLFLDSEKPVVICGSGLLRIDEAVNEEGRSVLPLKRFRVRFKNQ